MSNTKRTRQIRGCACLALAMSIAGSAVVAGKLIVSSLPVFLAAELGLLASLTVLLPLLFCRYPSPFRLDGKTHLILLGQAILGIVLYRIFMFWGLSLTSAAAGGLIGSAAPAMIALMAYFILHEKITATRLASVACVCLGILALQLPTLPGSPVQAGNAFAGNILILVAVTCEAGFSVMSKARCHPIAPLHRTALVSLYAFLCLLPFTLSDGVNAHWEAIPAATWLSILYYGLIVSFLSYTLWFEGIAILPASAAASFTGLVPIAGVFLSWAILDERISFSHWIALSCVLTGIALSCLPEKSLHLPAGR